MKRGCGEFGTVVVNATKGARVTGQPKRIKIIGDM